MTNAFFNENVDEKRGVMKHFLLDWPIEVHTLLQSLTGEISEVILNDIIHGDVQPLIEKS